MSKKYKVRVSIPIEYDPSDLMEYFESTITVDADSHEDAVSVAKTEFNDNFDLDSIYDEIYDELRTNMLIWLDGDYEVDTYDDDYYFAEEQKPRPIGNIIDEGIKSDEIKEQKPRPFPGMEGKGIDGGNNE